MLEYLKEQRKTIEETIYSQGLEKLRYSIFEGEENNKEEYQVRIEYKESYYEVYTTHERASIVGKYKFNDYESAKNKFFRLLELMVLSNRLAIQDGDIPSYPCSLWNN
ncbi:Imm59 family immunity protein [Listeria ivanovii]|uniref:Uncharacterized protein n=1 Tax=Listeria ivanovii (strain ATCC BAA-678 / PAM 55) TaxID=881621 RepID=G2Z8U3_LISIP|nr:Imm59 family immunity protein [Listeria ivanovii]AHI54688.1 hypothetical protein AX25_00585 [Listeria ivanovii WSLC3009]AIS61319.1 hypothetical protein JL53_00515 [Listeria ivanovii subsp. londoniensis]AIS64154.1 hypothetical protein JL52_00575 [Listeria ivanovii subsp. ivanovii]MBC1759566.1 hypothetical protein [Listeria ivanovii]MBK1966155.1 hypothetical protein [Listeria ivanovii subsp. londoniensis]